MSIMPSALQPSVSQPKTIMGARVKARLQRDMLFVSHANPEDNEFAQWLSLQLAKCGYPIWCDLTRLLGGEAFWTDIEEALRTRTAKFLYVLSGTSNTKDGPRNELQVAINVQREEKLRDFIIPLLIDELPHREINIQLSRLTAVNFRDGWAAGLRALLEKLERDGVQLRQDFSPGAVAHWWKAQHAASQGIKPEQEEHLSNWFAARNPLPQLNLHEVAGWPNNEKDGTILNGEWPAIRHDKFIVSFAKAEAFGEGYEIDRTVAYDVEDLTSGKLERATLDRTQARNLTTFLLKEAWERTIRSKLLSEYELANHAKCFWFHMGLVPDDTIHFVGIDERKTTRQVLASKV